MAYMFTEVQTSPWLVYVKLPSTSIRKSQKEKHTYQKENYTNQKENYTNHQLYPIWSFSQKLKLTCPALKIKQLNALKI